MRSGVAAVLAADEPASEYVGSIDSKSGKATQAPRRRRMVRREIRKSFMVSPHRAVGQDSDPDRRCQNRNPDPQRSTLLHPASLLERIALDDFKHQAGELVLALGQIPRDVIDRTLIV